MTGAVTASELAAEMQQAAAAGTDPLDVAKSRFPDKVTITHVPRIDQDGPAESAPVIDFMRAEQEALRRAMADYRQEVEVQVVDDAVDCDLRWRGTFSDGTGAEIALTLRFVIDDGAVVEMISTVDPSSYEPLLRAFQEGRLEIPGLEPRSGS